MPVRSVVIFDITPLGARRLLETVQAANMAAESVDSLEAFTATLASRRARVGVIAFEALWPDPQKSLRELREQAPNARLVVAYAEGTQRLRLGQRLWSVGLCDYFVSRSSPPHELAPVLRQAYADALIEGVVDITGGEDNPAMGRMFSRIRFLHNLNAALTNQRRIDGLVRELQMKLPQFLDYTVLEVLITSHEAPKLFVFQGRAMEHEVVWNLASEICASVAPFNETALTPEDLEFVEGAPFTRVDEPDRGPPEDNASVTIPMVFCGELVGAIGISSSSEISVEHRAILQLVAYQLASSIRNAQALEAAESDSLVDELTGASNRRYLKRALSAEWRRAERYRSPLSFAMIDIDHFKRINDTYGHLVGDSVLHSVAALLREQLRDTDHLVRYGGEEFLLLLPETSLRDATLVLERIRLMLTRTPVYDNERTGAIQITISAGVAGFPTCAASSGEELVSMADDALLVAKQSGRDRVCLASGQSFDSLGLEQDAPSEEKRRHVRIRSQLPVRFVELPDFEAKVLSMSATDVSTGGIAVAGPRESLKRNAYALVYLGDEQKPRLTQVKWTRDDSGVERAAGLQFLGAHEFTPIAAATEQPALRRRALVIAQDADTRATIERVMTAARYDVNILTRADEVKTEELESYSLLVLGASALRGELGQRLQELRNRGGGLQIALINESTDRRSALDTIRSQHADHLLTGGPSDDTLFATVSKLLLQEYFGVKKYLFWGAETRTWSLTTSTEKMRVLEGVKAMATEVRCHPRIADLLVSAVDEMIINALYRPKTDDVSRKPVTVECGCDGRFLGVAVIDEHGLFCHEDLFYGIGKALEHEQNGLADDAAHAHLGFRIMLSTLSHLVINVDPGACTEIIGLVDLRKSLKEYRTTIPSLGMFTNQRDK